jgi:hypothetical protein
MVFPDGLGAAKEIRNADEPMAGIADCFFNPEWIRRCGKSRT